MESREEALLLVLGEESRSSLNGFSVILESQEASVLKRVCVRWVAEEVVRCLF